MGKWGLSLSFLVYLNQILLHFINLYCIALCCKMPQGFKYRSPHSFFWWMVAWKIAQRDSDSSEQWSTVAAKNKSFPELCMLCFFILCNTLKKCPWNAAPEGQGIPKNSMKALGFSSKRMMRKPCSMNRFLSVEMLWFSPPSLSLIYPIVVVKI